MEEQPDNRRNTSLYVIISRGPFSTRRLTRSAARRGAHVPLPYISSVGRRQLLSSMAMMYQPDPQFHTQSNQVTPFRFGVFKIWGGQDSRRRSRVIDASTKFNVS